MKNKKIILLLLLTALTMSCMSVGGTKTITISGLGVVQAVPDRALFNLTFREVDQTTEQARDKVNLKVDRALSLLSGEGVKPENIKTTGLSYSTKTRWTDGQETVLGQEAVQVLKIIVDIDDKASRLNKIMDQLTAIDTIGIGGLHFEITRQDEYKKEARRLAYLEAEEKALAYAELSGMTLGKALHISESGFPSFAEKNTYARAEMMSYDTQNQVQTGVNDITIAVNVIFKLK